MQPEVGKPGAVARLGLRDLIGVMHRNVILAAAVNVKVGAKIFFRHCRAFNMPTREADAPRAVPLHLALRVPTGRGRAKFPEGKVGDGALFAQVNAHPAP